MSPGDDLPDLWSSVAHVAQDRVVALEQAVHAVRHGTADRASRCAIAVEEAEKLVGSLDSFGMTGGSALAARAAALLSSPGSDLEELSDVVARLRSLIS